MDKDTLIVIGKITGVHGLNGNLKVWPFSDSLESFEKGKSIRLSTDNEPEDWYTINKATPYKKGLLLILEGVDNRDKAENLLNREIYIKRGDLPELEDDTYYWQDLLGLEVHDQTRGYIGTIEHVFPTGANDVLVVKRNSSETLVPFIPSVILSVDIDNQKMDIDLPEGL